MVKPIAFSLAKKMQKNITVEKMYAQMKYDSRVNLNKIKFKKKYIPAIAINCMGTATCTRTNPENTDQDYSMNFFATRTITEVRAETTDSDYSSGLSLGTVTNTYVNIESTDTDFEI
jgi:hypothetical protein